jgi:UBX domain-containing protein 1
MCDDEILELTQYNSPHLCYDILSRLVLYLRFPLPFLFCIPFGVCSIHIMQSITVQQQYHNNVRSCYISVGNLSGLAVEPNFSDNDGSDDENQQESIFNMAEQAGASDEGQIRRTITMYRGGFVVDDGPYRRLDDPANAAFLRALATGQTPAELVEEAGPGGITVGLVDKRKEEYVETFRSFSGSGAALGSGNASENGVGGITDIDPSSLPEPVPVDTSRPTTSIAVRLPNGQRKVVKVNMDTTVLQLAAHICALWKEASGDDVAPFRLVSGFPPKPLEEYSATIDGAGLKGAQVQVQK